MREVDGVTAKVRGTTPPYFPLRTMKTFLQDLKEHGVPGRIDNSAMKRFSGGALRQLKTGLRFLNLIDNDDHPRDALRQLTAAYGAENWTSTLAELLKANYAPVLERVDLAHATPSQLTQAFKDGFGANASDDVLRKSQLFFLQAAQEAQLPLSKRIPVITRQRSPSSRRRPIARPENGNGDSGPRVEPPPYEQGEAKQPPSDPAADRRSEASLEAKLLDKFPSFDPAWSDAIKEQWFAGFQKLMGMLPTGSQNDNGS